MFKPTKKFLFSYYHDGCWWSLTIDAYDQQDARERLQKLPLAKYDGQLIMTVPLTPGLLPRLLDALKRIKDKWRRN